MKIKLTLIEPPKKVIDKIIEDTRDKVEEFADDLAADMKKRSGDVVTPNVSKDDKEDKWSVSIDNPKQQEFADKHRTIQRTYKQAKSIFNKKK